MFLRLSLRPRNLVRCHLAFLELILPFAASTKSSKAGSAKDLVAAQQPKKPAAAAEVDSDDDDDDDDDVRGDLFACGND